MKQNYIVMQQHRIRSRYGQIITQIDFVGVKDRLLYRTYIDPFNRNFANWVEILHHSDQGFLLANLQVKTADLISADSRPRILWRSPDREILYEELLSIWREEDSQSQLTV